MSYDSNKVVVPKMDEGAWRGTNFYDYFLCFTPLPIFHVIVSFHMFIMRLILM